MKRGGNGNGRTVKFVKGGRALQIIYFVAKTLETSYDSMQLSCLLPGPQGPISSRLKAEGSKPPSLRMPLSHTAPQAGPQLSNLKSQLSTLKSFFFAAGRPAFLKAGS